MKENICRAVTFYNDYIPPTGVEYQWEYCAMGIVDGIDVSDNILNDAHAGIGV